MSDDLDYNELDNGIRRLVKLLRSWCFETTDSGDGVSKKLNGTWDDDCCMGTPHVIIQVDNPADLASEADRLLRKLREIGVDIRQFGVDDGIHGGIEVTYDPVDRTCIIMLWQVTDHDIPDELGV